MKQTVLFLSIVLFSFVTSAQVADTSYTDCDNQTESIYGIIGQGTPLIIASKGLDCSICMGQAPAIKTFSEENPNVRVWGAMNFKYSSNQPTCTGANDWETDYAWNDIFMFLDLNDRWQGFSYPTYHVISPVDSQVVYSGPSFSQASAEALAVAPTGIASPERTKLSAQYDAATRSIWITRPAGVDEADFSVINSVGQIVFKTKLTGNTNDHIQIVLPEVFSRGVYLAVLQGEDMKVYTNQILVQQ